MKSSISSKFPFVIIVLLIIILATATLLERAHGTDWVQSHIYGAWWFSALWVVVAVGSIFAIV
jgi:hypothetical protein